MTFHICQDLLTMLHIKENIELQENKLVTESFYSIMNHGEGWEWDLISLFKTYDYYIMDPPKKYPICQCLHCSMEPHHNIHKTKNMDDLKRIVYIMEFMKTICDDLIYDHIFDLIHKKEYQRILERIDEYYEFCENFNEDAIHKLWPTKKKNYKKIMKMPKILRKAGVDLEHYQFRERHYFGDRIAGHPRASHGWAREGLEDTEKMGGFL